MPASILPSLIVTADDLGSSRAANLAIVQGMRDGHITHASMIVNMDGFEDACQRVLALGFRDRIGLHLNFTDSAPLTAEMAQCRRFCLDGQFRFPVQGRGAWPLSAAERFAVAAETRAQLARLRDAGFAVTYLDSHHHVHMQPNLAGTILSIAAESGIVRVRPPRFPDPTQSRLHRLKDAIFRRQLAAHHFPALSHLGDLDEALAYFDRGGAADPPMAILTHPALDAAGTVVDGSEQAPLSDRLKRLRPYLPDLIDDHGRVHEVLRAAG